MGRLGFQLNFNEITDMNLFTHSSFVMGALRFTVYESDPHRLLVGFYSRGRRGLRVFTSATFAECRINFTEPSSCIWVGGASFDLTPDEAVRLARAFPSIRLEGPIPVTLKRQRLSRAVFGPTQSLPLKELPEGPLPSEPIARPITDVMTELPPIRR